MSQLAVLTRRWTPATMKLGPFQEVILESSSVEELKEKVCTRHSSQKTSMGGGPMGRTAQHVSSIQPMCEDH